MKFGKRKIKIILIVIVMTFSAIFAFIIFGSSIFSNIITQPSHPISDISKTFWKYQCIDTMKTSRDKAREWSNRSDLTALINKEMKEIADLGSNCVAIDTPYDTEFLPYLKKWVTSARENKLKIWFRGNFSSWEGWFDYPKGMSNETLINRSKDFINNNKDLFEDGDIFTAAPEGENGGQYNQVEVDEYTSFRKFLIDEYNSMNDDFKNINKKVVVSWLSMNGGLAKRMLDQNTVDKIGKLVTIDHYIKTSQEMSEYINYFKNKFNAKVTIGEWGAPIPEINGSMTEKQQADFNESLLKELVKNKDNVEGINYWVLYDSSTALLRPDYSEKPSAQIIKKYFTPVIVKGTVYNEVNEPLKNAEIISGDGLVSTKTDQYGNYVFLLLSDNTEINIKKNNYKDINQKIDLKNKKEISQNIMMINSNPDFFYKLKLDLIR